VDSLLVLEPNANLAKPISFRGIINCDARYIKFHVLKMPPVLLREQDRSSRAILGLKKDKEKVRKTF